MSTVTLLFHDVYLSTPAESGFVSRLADRYKLTAEAFDAQLDGVARARATVTTVRRREGWPATASPQCLISVDDGGCSYFNVIADRLETRGWRGHCFVSTEFIGQSRFLSAPQIRELHRRGHVIGSHSASHPARFSACTDERMRAEWSRSRKVLEDLIGARVAVGSVPGGYFSAAVARTAAEAGLELLFTSEPTARLHRDGPCAAAGRFAIRRGSPPNFSYRLFASPAAARWWAWADWNAKKVAKFVLRSSYVRLADALADRPAAR
jgi:peptidoglycan/xylan/chitin deacetylase (PgdA/CDA1 family)